MDHADYAAAVAELRRQLLAYAAEVWDEVELGDAGLERLVELLVPTVLAAQTQIGNFTSIYLGEATGTQPLLVGDAITQGRGVNPETVYARPVITSRTALSQGKSPQRALAIGGKRLQNIVGTDLQMAKVRQSQQSLTAGGKQYFRRVLTGSENCALCTIASTQRYKTSRLMPIHPGCDCHIDVLPRGMDLNQVVDPQLLEQTHQQVKAIKVIDDRSGRMTDYRKLIMTREHGEVGPVLTWRHQQFTAKSDL